MTSLLSVFVGTRMALLLNCGLCWEAPLAWHLPVQAACVALVACYGTTAFCGSQVRRVLHAGWGGGSCSRRAASRRLSRAERS